MANLSTIEKQATVSRSLLLFACFFGGMVSIAGVFGAKQVALSAVLLTLIMRVGRGLDARA